MVIISGVPIFRIFTVRQKIWRITSTTGMGFLFDSQQLV